MKILNILTLILIISCTQDPKNLSPKETVLKTIKAMKSGDVLTLDQYIDFNSITNDLLSNNKNADLIIKQLPNFDPFNLMFQSNPKGKVAYKLKDLLINKIKNLKERKVNKSELNILYYQVKEPSFEKELIDMATVGVSLFNNLSKKIEILELRLLNKEGYWRITKIENPQGFIKTIVQENKRIEREKLAIKRKEIKRKQAIAKKKRKVKVKKLNSKIALQKKKIEKIVGKVNFKKYMQEGEYSFYDSMIDITSSKKLREDIKEVTFRLYCRSNSWVDNYEAIEYTIPEKDMAKGKPINASYRLTDIGNIERNCSPAAEVVKVIPKNGKVIDLSKTYDALNEVKKKI